MAFKGDVHGSPLPLGVQSTSQGGQQVGLDIGRIFKPETLKPCRSTGAFGSFVLSLGQQSAQRPCRYSAGSTPERALLYGGESARGHKALNLTRSQGKALGLALAHILNRARAAVVYKLLPQSLERQGVQCQMMPHQHKNAPATLLRKYSPKGVAAFRIQPCSDTGHGLAQQGYLLH